MRYRILHRDYPGDNWDDCIGDVNDYPSPDEACAVINDLIALGGDWVGLEWAIKDLDTNDIDIIIRQRRCEWGDCDAVATETVAYPAFVAGYQDLTWHRTEERHMCETCAVVARAEVYARWPRYQARDDSGTTEALLDAETNTEAIEAAEEWLEDGDWRRDGSTYTVNASVERWAEEQDRWEWVGYASCTVDPDPPACLADAHKWTDPRTTAGPGGGVTIRETCRHCGCVRWIQTAGSDGRGGTTETVSYDPADETSLAWIVERG